MPVFDLLTVNEKHLAKVNVIRSEMHNTTTVIKIAKSVGKTVHVDSKLSFEQWMKYIQKENKRAKHLSTITIKRIFA